MAKGIESFDGTRLVQAREIRGLTGVNLASLTNISTSSISQYEKGTANPPVEAIEKLASALNVSKCFFLHKYKHLANPVFYYRSLSTATKTARRRAERKYEWLIEIADYLETFFDFPSLNLPDLDLPKDCVSLTGDDIEDFARQCREFWRLSNTPIPHVIRLLERNGVITTRLPLEAQSLDGLSESNAYNRPVIMLASDKSSCVRSRFDAAHELAHILIHRKLQNGISRTSAMHNFVESQAHRFAAALLLPRKPFMDDFVIPSLDSFAVLKERWKVSISMMIKRCRDLGLINEDIESKLYMNLARRGWKRREPLDDKLQSEEPKLFRQCFDAMIQAKFKSRSQIIQDLDLPSRDVEELCSLPDGYFDDSFGEILKMPEFKRQPTTSDYIRVNRSDDSESTVIPFRDTGY